MRLHPALEAGLLAAVLVVPAVQLEADDEQTVTLTGCLLKGDRQGEYFLTDQPPQPAGTFAANAVVTREAVGTSGAFTTVFYWLSGDVLLNDHVGRRVEIEGHVKGARRPGELRLERKENWTELEIRSDGRSLKARVPAGFIVSVVSPEGSLKIATIVRRVDASHVRMIAASCE